MARPEDEEVARWIETMRRHVAAAPEIYRPGVFWSDLIERNLEMLRADGVRNFKRTVSNNYYNWLVLALPDPQMRNAIRNWMRHPHLTTLRARMEPARELRTMSGQGTRSTSPRRRPIATASSSPRHGSTPSARIGSG